MKKRARSSYKGKAALLALAAVLFCYSLSVSAPVRIAAGTSRVLTAATATLSASVPPNPDNMLNAQLQERAAQLNEREAQLDARESESSWQSVLGVYSFFISIALLLLVAANFYFDMRRAKRGPGALGSLSIDLR